MRAARCNAHGPPESISIEEVVDPEAGPEEVVVAVRAASVNYPDVLIIGDRYQVSTPTPFTPGSEFAGIVLEVGARVSALRAGDAVRGSMMTGAFAERVVAPEAALSRIPQGLSFPEAASFSVTGRTAFIALRSVARAQPGEWVVVLGAAGGVGSAALDVAKRLGCRTVAIASTEAKRAACLEWGADVVLDAGRVDLKQAIRAATGGGADIVLDPVGGSLAEPALRALRFGGRFVTVGYAAGEIPRIPLNLVLLKGIEIRGLDVRTYPRNAPEQAARDAKDFEALVAEGLRPRIGAVFEFEEVGRALELVGSRGAIGKVVVELDRG